MAAEPDADATGAEVIRRSEYAEVRAYPDSKGTTTVLYKCPCGFDVAGADVSLARHLERDHGPDDFPL